MSKIVAKSDMALVENNGRTVVYEYDEDVVVIPSRIATTDGGATFEQCDAVIADGREFLASCAALYGIFSVKAMEE